MKLAGASTPHGRSCPNTLGLPCLAAAKTLRDWLCCCSLDCTGGRFVDESKPTDEAEKDFRNLVQELVRISGDDELFNFVIYPEADGTNNISERHLREPAKVRVTGQANKTLRAAQRRTVITSVLDSIRLNRKIRALHSVIEGLKEWAASGVSGFRREVEKRQGDSGYRSTNRLILSWRSFASAS